MGNGLVITHYLHLVYTGVVYMKFDLLKASRKLSELEFKLKVDSLAIDILWFRAMVNEGEWAIARHTHSSFEFHFIASGSCKVIHDGGEFVINAGEFYLTAPSVYHEQKSTGTGKFIEYSLNCDLKLEEDKPSEAKQVYTVLSKTPCRQFKDSQGIIKIFYKALNEAYHQDFGFYNSIKSLIVLILFSAARTICPNLHINNLTPLKKQKDDYRLTQIERFIEDNLSSNISPIDIASVIHLSDKQVCRIIRERKGLSTKELIMQIKLQKAKQLLKETNLPIKQIAYELGFSSEYYFNQFFKREEGYPPGVFRVNIQNV